MKKRLTTATVLLLIFALIFSASVPAYADGKISNQIKNGGNSAAKSTSGRDLFYTASNSYRIEQPGSGDYYSSPFTRYVNAPKGHSVYVYDYWSATDEHQIGTTFHGGRVTVVAEHGDYSCILFHEQDYTLKVAWIRSANLSASYPGNEQKVGWILDPNPIDVGDPEMSWSRDFFVGTGRKYSLLREPIKDCVYFTLDYHVTSRNGAQTSEVVGPRDVYVNDGTGWIWVGRFEYPRTEACHVKISLVDRTTIAALAVIADCAKPDTFVCRQSLLDVKRYGGDSYAYPSYTRSTPNPTPLPTPKPQSKGPAPGTFSGSFSDYSLVPFYSAAASSELKEGDIRFIASYAMDDSVNRPWVEGVRGNGAGETLTLYFNGTKSIDILSLRLGYARDSYLYYANNRPKTIYFSFSDGSSFNCTFADRNEEQIVELGRTIDTSYVSMTLSDVYSGDCDDTCIYLVKAYCAK